MYESSNFYFYRFYNSMSVNSINIKTEPYNNRLNNIERKKAYLKNNPLSYEEEKKNLQRIDNLLNAIDVIDDYSAKKVDDTKRTGYFFSSVVDQGFGYLGTILGAIIGELPFVKKYLTKIASTIDVGTDKFVEKTKIKGKLNIPKGEAIIVNTLPILLGAFFGYLISNPIASLISKLNNKLYRNEFTEIMHNELSDPKYFALLNDEQQQKVEYLMRTKISNHDIKNEYKQHSFNVFNDSRVFFNSDNNEDEYFNNYNANAEKMSRINISNAQEDKELLLDAMAKIEDDASKYSQKVDKITNILSLTADIVSIVGITKSGFDLITSKMSKMSIKNKIVSFVSAFLPLAFAIILSYVSKYLGAESEKLGRFVAKENLRHNPEALYYVNKEKYANYQEQAKSEFESKGLFKDLLDIYKDYNEYSIFHSRYQIENRKRQKAMGQIDLNKNQLDRAKMFQKNTFMVCNNFYNKKYNVNIKSEEKKSFLNDFVSFVLNMTAMILAPLFISLNWNSVKSFAKGITDYRKMDFKDVLKGIKAFSPSLLAVVLPCGILYKLKNKSSDNAHQYNREVNSFISTNLDNLESFV